MDPTAWLIFVLIETALCLTPGPAVLYAFSSGARYGLRTSLSANAGVVTGNSIYFVLSALGLGAILLASHTLFTVIKWAGVVYLIWLGVTMMLSARDDKATPLNAPPMGKIYRGGVLLQLANPKSLVFFGAILPQFIDPSGNVWLQFLILGVTSQVIEAVVLGLYGYLAVQSASFWRSSEFALWVNRMSGGLLAILGIGLASYERTAR